MADPLSFIWLFSYGSHRCRLLCLAQAHLVEGLGEVAWPAARVVAWAAWRSSNGWQTFSPGGEQVESSAACGAGFQGRAGKCWCGPFLERNALPAESIRQRVAVNHPIDIQQFATAFPVAVAQTACLQILVAFLKAYSSGHPDTAAAFGVFQPISPEAPALHADLHIAVGHDLASLAIHALAISPDQYKITLGFGSFSDGGSLPLFLPQSWRLQPQAGSQQGQE